MWHCRCTASQAGDVTEAGQVEAHDVGQVVGVGEVAVEPVALLVERHAALPVAQVHLEARVHRPSVARLHRWCRALSVGHRVGLFDAMAGMRPATSDEIAGAAGPDERYVRQWLGAMGVQQARRMFAEAGFTDIEVRTIEGDPVQQLLRLPQAGQLTGSPPR